MTFRSPSLFCALALTGALSACGAPGAGSAPPAAESSEPGTSTPGSGEAPDDDANFPDTAPDAPSDPSDNPNSSAPGANPNIPASVHLVGRFDTNNPAGPRFTWPNSTVVVTFKGTGLRAKLAAMVPGSTTRMSDYYDVWVDGQGPRPLNLTAGATEYILCDGLANGTHTVRLIKRTESRYSTGQLLGVETEPPGGLLPSPAPERRIEFIGDSITAGYGTLATNPNDPVCQVNRGQDAERTYAALTARAVGAEFVNISWTGVGVLSPVNGATASSLHARTLATDPASKWGFQWIPQAVVINLGTNDAPLAAANPTAFVEAYGNLLATVRTHYPQATILCVLGPMLQGEELATVRNGITAALQAREAAGDARVSYLELPPDDGSNGYACVQHPLAATQARMATQVTQTLRTLMQW